MAIEKETDRVKICMATISVTGFGHKNSKQLPSQGILASALQLVNLRIITYEKPLRCDSEKTAASYRIH
jgi:hypothetical protein